MRGSGSMGTGTGDSQPLGWGGGGAGGAGRFRKDMAARLGAADGAADGGFKMSAPPPRPVLSKLPDADRLAQIGSQATRNGSTTGSATWPRFYLPP
jgi:hypothetical protein